MPAISVIIVNWNGAQFLPRCFQSLREQTWRGFQVLLVDNGSTDDSVTLTSSNFPEVDIVVFGRNLGYAEANNRAASLTEAQYLFFLNNDTHLHSDALATLVSTAESHPDIAIWAPQQRTYDGTHYLNAGMSIDLLGYPCVGNPPAHKLFYADGACLFIRRAIFNALGGFDPQHFMFFEETDLCWRAWLWGYRVAAVPQAIVFHKAGGTAGSSIVKDGKYTTSRNKRRLAHRNQWAMIIKNYSAITLCVAVPLFAALTLAEVFVLAATGQRAALKDAYVPAWGDLLRGRSRLLTMRRHVQASRVVSDCVILRRMEWRLVTVQHFLRGARPTIT